MGRKLLIDVNIYLMFTLLTMFFKKEKIIFTPHSIQVGSTQITASLYQFLNNQNCQNQLLNPLKKGTKIYIHFTQDVWKNSPIEETIISRIKQICYERQLHANLYSKRSKIKVSFLSKKQLLLGIALLIFGINTFLDFKTATYTADYEKQIEVQNLKKNRVKSHNSLIVSRLKIFMNLPVEIESISLTPSNFFMTGFCTDSNEPLLESQIKTIEAFSSRPIQTTSALTTVPYIYISIKGESRWKS